MAIVRSSGTINIQTVGPGTPPLVVTQPERILRHSISDEELDMLCEARSDFVLEILLAALGAVLGTLPGAISGMVQYARATPDVPFVLGLADFVQVIMLWASVAVAAATGFVFARRNKRSLSLRSSIRARARTTTH